MIGHTVAGRYHIISHLGSGSFGKTYLAEDRKRSGNPKCVVKQLKPQAKDTKTLEVARRLFESETQVLHKLGTHPQIPELLDYFEENQEFYLVQEFILGQDLGEELTPGKCLSESDVIKLLADILEILAFVHQQNIIHRDIKPQNIRRREDGKIFLIDFGAVKEISTQFVNPQGMTSLTVAIGTPGYMPNEQANRRPKFSSDIYAVGMIGIQALTGILPYELPEDENGEIVWRDRVQVSTEFADILDKMVLYDFRQRYRSAVEALPDVTNLITPLSQPVTQSQNAEDLLNQGDSSLDLQRYEEALACYEQAIQFKPDCYDAWNRRGIALRKLQRYEEALASYDKAIQVQPNCHKAWGNRGWALHKLQRYQEAITSYDQAIQLKPDFHEAWHNRGLALYYLQRYQEAVASYDKAIQLKPNFHQAWYNQGNALKDLHRYEEAIASYDKAIQLKPDKHEAWYKRGNALADLRRYQEALASYDKAILFKPDDHEAWHNQGNVLHDLQRHQEAIACYDKVIQIKPDFHNAWYNRGNALRKLQRYQEAIASYDKAIQIKPDKHEAWNNRGVALQDLQQYQEAITSYDKAIQFKPDYQLAIDNRNIAQNKLKR